jgi:N-acetylmuramoyl-L-alanine amidase
MAALKITVTAGHGNGDPGAVANGVREGELVTELRDILASKLRAAGAEVSTDGTRWQNLPLVHALTLVPGRAWAMELHTNASANPAANGVEVVALARDKIKAQAVAKTIADVLGFRLRGDGGWIDQAQSARGRLGYVNAGGMVVELFFLTNSEELQVYQEKKWLVASALAKLMTGA